MRQLPLLLLAALTVLVCLQFPAFASSDAPPWWDPDWRFREEVTLHEKVGVERVWEPTLVRFLLPAERVSDPSRELRVLAWSGKWIEVPSQILSCRREGDEVLVELAFLANSSPRVPSRLLFIEEAE